MLILLVLGSGKQESLLWGERKGVGSREGGREGGRKEGRRGGREGGEEGECIPQQLSTCIVCLATGAWAT